MNVSGVNSTALLLLTRSRFAYSEQNKPKSSDLSAIVNGQSAQTSQVDATGPASDALRELTKLKVALYQKMGEALGVRMEDYPSASDYGAALRGAVARLKSQDPAAWPAFQARVEHELGLDKLGVSLDEAIDSLTDAESAKKMNEALMTQIRGGGASRSALGTYSPASVKRQPAP